MRRFLLATHGSFADGIKSSIELIIGSQPELATICGYLTPGFDLEAAIRDHLGRVAPGDELVIMTDAAGGSVNNAFMAHLDHPGVHLVTGLNLPLALTILSANEDDPVEKVIAEAVETGQEGILYCNELSESSDDEGF